MANMFPSSAPTAAGQNLSQWGQLLWGRELTQEQDRFALIKQTQDAINQAYLNHDPETAHALAETIYSTFAQGKTKIPLKHHEDIAKANVSAQGSQNTQGVQQALTGQGTPDLASTIANFKSAGATGGHIPINLGTQGTQGNLQDGTQIQQDVFRGSGNQFLGANLGGSEQVGTATSETEAKLPPYTDKAGLAYFKDILPYLQTKPMSEYEKWKTEHPNLVFPTTDKSNLDMLKFYTTKWQALQGIGKTTNLKEQAANIERLMALDIKAGLGEDEALRTQLDDINTSLSKGITDASPEQMNALQNISSFYADKVNEYTPKGKAKIPANLGRNMPPPPPPAGISAQKTQGYEIGKQYQDAQGRTATYKGKDAQGKDIWEG